LFRLLDLSYILVTRGEQGMVLFEKKGGVQQIPAVAREVFDVTGAGDTVIATFALAYASGVPAREAVVLASAAAAQVVSKAGTATAAPEEILQAIRENGLGSFARSAAKEWSEVVASA
jgi:D-beta-D-heptose 7-phosphate kinase/D-beta-D-heptose 1-phosphate adenosyltransferase